MSRQCSPTSVGGGDQRLSCSASGTRHDAGARVVCPLTLGRYADSISTRARAENRCCAPAPPASRDRCCVTEHGTRDQLYLALRLAALEGLIARRGPLPLLLDDLFVHFDDARTDAGLRVLEQIAERTQVLLFTHHQRVAEQALGAISAAGAPHRTRAHDPVTVWPDRVRDNGPAVRRAREVPPSSKVRYARPRGRQFGRSP